MDKNTSNYLVQVSQSATCPFLYLLHGQSLWVAGSEPTQLRRRLLIWRLHLCDCVLYEGPCTLCSVKVCWQGRECLERNNESSRLTHTQLGRNREIGHLLFQSFCCVQQAEKFWLTNQAWESHMTITWSTMSLQYELMHPFYIPSL